MYKLIKAFLSILCIILFASSCMYFPDKDQKLQYVYDMYGLDFDQHKTIYTKHNIWFDDPENIIVRYCEGKYLIPFGTEIKFIESYPGYVIFETKDNEKKQLRINNDTEETLLPDDEYFHRIFTEKNPMDELKGMSEKDLKALKEGRIYKGMTRQEVLIAYGSPPRLLNPFYHKKTTWMYIMDDQYRIRHVVFKDDKVSYVFDV